METKISIVRKTWGNMSYFIDENDIVKGEWGGFEEEISEDEIIFKLYYSKYHKYTWVTDYGCFYGIISCRRYDKVLFLRDNLYLCEKNERFGIIEINEEYEEVVVLDICYKDIKLLNDSEFICESETGKFYYNLKTNERSAVYDDVIYNYDKRDDCLVVNYDKKYGLIDHHGRVIVRPFCKSYNIDGLSGYRSELIFLHDSVNHHVYIDKGRFFGRIDPNDYYICYKSKSSTKSIFETFYIAQSKVNFGWGILNSRGAEICTCIYNNIIDDGFYIQIYKENRLVSHPCFICVFEDKYSLFDANEGKYVIENCSLLKTDYFAFFGKKVLEKSYIEYINNGKHGFITNYGKIISEDEYDDIELLNECFVVSKNKKYGVLNYAGLELLPCQYDNIVEIRGNKIIAKINDDVNEIVRKDYFKNNNNISIYEGRHYNQYGGYQGYSDEEIDTIFDGDPSAYWNID